MCVYFCALHFNQCADAITWRSFFLFLRRVFFFFGESIDGMSLEEMRKGGRKFDWMAGGG